MFRYLLVFFTTVIFHLNCFAFINVESYRNSPSDGEQGQLSLSLDHKKGNSETIDYLIEGLNYSRFNQKEYVFLVSYKYGERKDVKDEDKSLVHLRYAAGFSKKMAMEFYLQYEKDEFTRLSFRGLAGTGVRYTLLRSLDLYSHFGAGVFYSEETLDEKTGTSDAGTLKVGRGNFYLSFLVPLFKNTELSSVTYFQPNIVNLYDHRLQENFKLSFKLEKNLKMALYYQLAHDNDPPELVKTTDSKYGTKFIFKF